MKKIIYVFMFLFIPLFLKGEIIVTIAGDGSVGFKDKLSALQCQFNMPVGLSVDEDGNVYIADSKNNRIRIIKKKKGDDYYEKAVVKTIAGNGVHGYNGTSVLAVMTSLGEPKGVCTFKKGDHYIVYISDTKNNIIRRIDKKGYIRRVAGNVKFGYIMDGVKASATSLGAPHGIFVDKNENIYIADTLNHRIRVVYNKGKVTGLKTRNPKKGYIYTIAGNGKSGSGGDLGPALSAYVGEPYDVFVDHKNDIYIAQKVGSIVRKVDSTTGTITTVAGIPGKYGYTGDHRLAVKEQLNQPFGVFVDLLNNIFIADGNNMRIRKVDPKGIITTIAGQGFVGYRGDDAPSENSLISYPLDITGDNKGNIFISDSENSDIRMITKRR